MKSIATLLCALSAVCAFAETPWKVRLQNKDEQVSVNINLYEETVNVPGMEMFGPMNGYLMGKGVFGTWMVTSFEIESDKRARIRFSNDQGADTQEVRLTWQSDSTCLFEIPERVVIRKVINKKFHPITEKFVLKVQ